MKTRLSPTRSSRNGVTLLECAGASIILGLMVTAGLRAAAGAGAAQATSARALTGSLLAEGLLNEITSLAYIDANGLDLIGVDAGELASDKSTFDDVDDFENWIETPPKAPDGTPMANMDKWSRAVRVFRAQINSLETKTNSEAGLKRIRVTVSYSGKVVCTLQALRAADQ